MKINNHRVKNKESAFNSKKSEKPPFCFSVNFLQEYYYTYVDYVLLNLYI